MAEEYTNTVPVYKYFEFSDANHPEKFRDIVGDIFADVASHYLEIYKLYCCLELFLDGPVVDAGEPPVATAAVATGVFDVAVATLNPRSMSFLQGAILKASIDLPVAVHHLSNCINHVKGTDDYKMKRQGLAWVSLYFKLNDEIRKLMSKAGYLDAKYQTPLTSVEYELTVMRVELNSLGIERCLKCKKIKA